MAAASIATTARAPAGDIEARHWQGGPVDCSACDCRFLRALPAEQGCEPGHACVQDAYARRIDRFFRWHPDLADSQLAHPYFEVRAIAARHASVFRLPALIDDPDETVRLQVALRLPLRQLVRIRVAQRIEGPALAAMRSDADYGVRELVARRLPEALLATLMHDPDRSVRMRVAQRLPMPTLLALGDDEAPEVRRIVAERVPAALLDRLADDPDWRVRWEAARRGAPALAARLRHDPDPEVRNAAEQRLTEGASHG